MAVKMSAVLQAKLLAMLVDAPHTVHELAAETGLHIITVSCYVRALRRERLVHIGAWEKDSMGRDCTAVWAWGRGRDKPRGKMTNAERRAAYRQRQAQRAVLQMMAGQLKEAA